LMNKRGKVNPKSIHFDLFVGFLDLHKSQWVAAMGVL